MPSETRLYIWPPPRPSPCLDPVRRAHDDVAESIPVPSSLDPLRRTKQHVQAGDHDDPVPRVAAPRRAAAAAAVRRQPHHGRIRLLLLLLPLVSVPCCGRSGGARGGVRGGRWIRLRLRLHQAVRGAAGAPQPPGVPGAAAEGGGRVRIPGGPRARRASLRRGPLPRRPPPRVLVARLLLLLLLRPSHAAVLSARRVAAAAAGRKNSGRGREARLVNRDGFTRPVRPSASAGSFGRPGFCKHELACKFRCCGQCVASARGKGKGVVSPWWRGRKTVHAGTGMHAAKQAPNSPPPARAHPVRQGGSIPTGYRDGPMHVLRTALLFALLTAASCGYTY